MHVSHIKRPATFGAGDRLCPACHGTGIIDMSDPERRSDSPANEYCDCQREACAEDRASSAIRAEREVAAMRYADDNMSSNWLMQYTPEELEEMIADNDIPEHLWLEGYNRSEMVGVSKSWIYRAPEPSTRPYSDSFGIGQKRCAEIALETHAGGMVKAAATVLNTAPTNELSRQSASRVIKNSLREYRRAQAALASEAEEQPLLAAE